MLSECPTVSNPFHLDGLSHAYLKYIKYGIIHFVFLYQSKFQNDVFQSLKIAHILTNSADPDKMQLVVAFYQGDSLQKMSVL